MNVEPYRAKLIGIISDLIENKGVTQFYSGYRGSFDLFCSGLIKELKAIYPQIKYTLVLSYIPTAPADPEEYGYKLPDCFDDSVYLLERNVPKAFAIIETNKLLADKVDYIVAGVLTHFGGAYMACEYAGKRKKSIINVIELGGFI